MPTNEAVNAEERSSYTMDEICTRNSISRALLNDLIRQGLGPKVMYLGRVMRVSAEEERKWLEKRSNPDAAELKKIKEERKKYSRIGVIAGTASAASPKHISKRHRRRAR